MTNRKQCPLKVLENQTNENPYVLALVQGLGRSKLRKNLLKFAISRVFHDARPPDSRKSLCFGLDTEFGKAQKWSKIIMSISWVVVICRACHPL